MEWTDSLPICLGQDSLAGEGQGDMDAENGKALAKGVAALDMGL